MASVPGASPFDNAMSQLGAMPAEDRARLTKETFDSISEQTGAPVNVLMALDEANGGGGDAGTARQNAKVIADALKGGAKMSDVIASFGGTPDRTSAIVQRSKAIADALYPTQSAQPGASDQSGSPGIGTDLSDAAKALGSGALSGIGSAARAAGVFGDEALKGIIQSYGTRDASAPSAAPVEGETFVRGAGRSAQDFIQRGADAASDSISDRGKRAMAGSQPDGNIFDPKSVSLGSDPSVRGYALNALQGAGSMAPIVATGMLTGPVGAAVAGGLMSGGEGAQNGRQFVIDAYRVKDKNGRPEIEAFPEYKKLVDAGKTPEQATMALARRAETDAGFRQAIFGAIGGAATERIFGAAHGWLGSGGRIARATKKAGAGFLEEGSQETAEGVASQSGIKDATGANIDLGEGSFGNFVLGGLSGGAVGGAGGLLFGGSRDEGKQDQPAEAGDQDSPLALSKPEARQQIEGPLGSDRALPAPEDGGTIFAPGRAGTAPGEVERDPAAPRRPDPAEFVNQPANLRPSRSTLPPDNVGDGGEDATTQAEPEPTLALPAPANGGTIFGGGRAGTAPGEIERDPASLSRPGMDDFAQQPANLRPGRNAPVVGSDGGAVTAPDGGSFLSAPTGAVANDAAAAPPAGPITAAARMIQQPKPVEAHPARFPEHKPGAAIKLGDPETGKIFDGVFLGETPNGARVRIGGNEVELSPQEFDMGRDAARGIEAQQMAAKARTDAMPKEKPAPQLADNPGDIFALEAQNAPAPSVDSLTDRPEITREAADVRRPERPNSYAAAPALDDATRAAQIRDRLSYLASQGKANGWTAKLATERAAREAELSEIEARMNPPSTAGTEPEGNQPFPTIEPIRARAAVLRGIPEDQAPKVPGVPLKWDEAQQGFVFSRNHVERVRAAISPRSGETNGTADGRTEGGAEAAQERGVDQGAAQGVQGVVRSGSSGGQGWPNNTAASEVGPASDERSVSDAARAGEQASNLIPTQKKASGPPAGAVKESLTADLDRTAGRNPEDWPWRRKKINSANRRKATADYLRPGNVVRGYGGDFQRIESFDPETRSIAVEGVRRQGDNWVGTGKRRTHGSLPEDHQLVRGPVYLAPKTDAAPVEDAARKAKVGEEKAPAPQEQELTPERMAQLRRAEMAEIRRAVNEVSDELERAQDDGRPTAGIMARLDDLRKQAAGLWEKYDQAAAATDTADQAENAADGAEQDAKQAEPPARPGNTTDAATPAENKPSPSAEDQTSDHTEQSIAAEASRADREPTDAQKEAGNYQKGHLYWNGLDLTIENAKGSERRGTSPDGKSWSVTMPAHYGYFRGTIGADGDHVDFYMGDDPASNYVLIVDQADADTGKFDEHKIILGAKTHDDALELYRKGFSDGRSSERIGGLTDTTVSALKDILSKGIGKDPLSNMDRPYHQKGEEPDGGTAARPGALAEPAATDARRNSGKIEDFGEKIIGARKDVWASYADLMRDAKSADVSAEPLSKSWPAPDYQKMLDGGADPWTVAFIRAARDAIPTKPQKSWRLKGWVDQVQTLRGLANDLLDGKVSPEDMRQRITGPTRGFHGLADSIDLYLSAGHARSLRGLHLVEARYSVLDGVRHEPPLLRWEVTQAAKATAFSNMPHTIAHGDTRDDALSDFKQRATGLETAQAKAKTGAKFEIYTRDGRKTWRVGVKIGRNRIDLQSFDTVADARKAIATDSDALQAQFDRMRDIPRERRDENQPRVGIDHRAGADVTPEQFGETFGFRGVQFGNWVEGDRRQKNLNEAYDALLDLAGILDIPPRAISLNGTLGLAFGARGSGGKNPAAAHYEPGQVVINLTKRSGAGSLAHEWFHALDNYFSRAIIDRPDKMGFITDRAARAAHPEGVRPELMDAFIALRSALNRTGLRERSANIDKMRTSPYWSTGIEMQARAFESYVVARLQDQNASNDFLANIVNGGYWQMQAELAGLGDSYPYLTAEEVDATRPAFDGLFDVMQVRDTPTGTELYQRDMSGPVVTLTGDELGPWTDVRQLGRKASAWYRNNLIDIEKPVTVTNRKTGWKIEFNGKGAGKVGGRKGEDLYRAVVAIPDILRDGVVIKTEPDNRGRKDIKAIHKIAATVRLGGRDLALIATVRETAAGKFHYDLSMSSENGGRSETALRQGEAQLRSPALEGASADINLDFATPEINAVPAKSLQDIARTLREIISAHGLTGKVSPAAVRGLLSAAGVPVLGAYRNGQIRVNQNAANPDHVMRHEIIHALRDANLWGASHGLFTPTEWRALSRAARSNDAIRKAVEAAYPDLSASQQTEEMVAEMYADWASARAENPPGAVGRALERILSFLRATAAALRGEGFQDAAGIMERIASGEIGGRGPDGGVRNRNTDNGREASMVNTATRAFRDWFGDSKVVNTDGAPMVVTHGSGEANIEAMEGLELPGWFAEPSDNDLAATYGNNRYDAYLSIRNPIRVPVDMNDEVTLGELLDALNWPRSEWPGGDLMDQSGPAWEVVNRADFADLASKKGYDGISVPEGGTPTWAIFKPSQAKSVDNRGTFDPSDDRIAYQRPRGANDEASRFAADVMAQLAAVDDLFAYPMAKAKTLKGVMAEIDPSVKFIGDMQNPDEADASGADRRYLLRTGNGKDFFVFETDDEVWLDVSRLDEGGAGSAIYAAVADYAANTGRVFIGDPAGLSDIALRRRTDAMLSSALKHGSTDHLAPHRRQIEGDESLGVPPLAWTDGDYYANIASMIEASTASLANLVPEITRARYDFATRTFRTGKGEPLTDRALAEWSAVKGRIRAARAGSKTLKRSILLNTLLRAEGSQKPGLLERSLRQSGQLVADGGLSGTFYQKDLSDLKDRLMTSGEKARGMIGDLHWKRTPQAAARLWNSLLTDAMGRNDRFNILSLVPGHPLFSELGKNLPGAQTYLRLKERMDAERNEWQARSATVVDKWTAAARKNQSANRALMKLMHETTLAGIDPTKDDGWRRPVDAEADRVTEKDRKERRDWAEKIRAERAERMKQHADLRRAYEALPRPFRDLYTEVRDEYSAMADAMDAALMENIRASSRVIIKRADREHRKELDRIRDEGLTGKERADALSAANDKLAAAHARAGRGEGARLKQLRQLFEQNRLDGPYFPLARFGNYFVTLRDADGKVTSFSRFATEREQARWAAEAKRDGLGAVETGVLNGDPALREKVDPRFLADVEDLMAESGAPREVMDQVWQRWLETLPDQSLRTNRIHRKGRAGFNDDAVRAFASGMFHGAHQQARLRYGADMEEALEEAKEQAKASPDPNRSGFVVTEMEKRHEFTMQPTNNPMVTAATTASFIWYLGMSPAAALVNLSQTTIVGVPLMGARYKGGVNGAIRELSRASADFVRGRGKVSKKVNGIPVWTDIWTAENSPHITADERKAMAEGYSRGVIDKTQSHDLAAVADSGVQYNPRREKIMRVIGWGFHHGERFNRETTFLASYRLARADGMSHDAAIESAADMTWKTHFDYSNTARPRAMQGDAAKVLLIFRNFQFNMLYRMFRDVHQALAGATAEDRAEARIQLIGVSLSMFAHAGIRGVWGYAILTTLLAMFLPGADDGDDVDEWLQDALLMDGDGAGVAAWNWIMSAALNGAPGQVLRTDLTNRIGMPDLFFRSPGRDLEGKDWWAYMLEQIGGPAVSILGNLAINVPTIADQAMNAAIDHDQFNGDEFTRAVESSIPTFMRNVLKTGRYAFEGVTTRNGDPLIEAVNPWQLALQLQGFTPAEVAERYRINTRLKNEEAQITDRRRDILKAMGDPLRRGEAIPESTLQKRREFNAEFPFWPITADAVRQSARSRERASQRNEFGATLNPKLNDYLRGGMPPSQFN